MSRRVQVTFPQGEFKDFTFEAIGDELRIRLDGNLVQIVLNDDGAPFAGEERPVRLSMRFIKEAAPVRPSGFVPAPVEIGGEA